MNLKALTAFCLIRRRGSLSAAAKAMHLSQPAVSRLVSNLEREVGFALFHRDRRTLRPTDEARRFHREAERILAGVEGLRAIARDIRAGGGQRLRVIAMARLATGLLPRAAAAFRAEMPEVGLTTETHHRRDMERWLTGRQFDVGFGPLPVGEPTLDVELLGTLPAVVAVAPNHPLAAAEALTAEVLAEHPMVALTPDTLLQGQTDAIFAAAGVAPSVALRTSSAQVACLLAAEGLGYAITDPLTARSLGASVRAVPLRPTFPLAYGALWPRGESRSAAAERFARRVADELARLS